jgi:hypothetical protein
VGVLNSLNSLNSLLVGVLNSLISTLCTVGVAAGEVDNGPVRARLEGLEPPTPGFEGRYSIQLSYRRLEVIYHITATGITRLS